MPPFDAAVVATTGAICLALCAVLLALAERRRAARLIAEADRRLARAAAEAEAALSGAEAFQSALIAVEDGVLRLASGEEALADCARALGADARPEALLEALRRADVEADRRLAALLDRGEPCSFEVRGQGGAVSVEGRTSGALAWLRLSAAAGAGLPSPARFAALLDAQPGPAWIIGPQARGKAGPLLWANRAWLDAAEALTVEDAARRGLTFDRTVDQLAMEAASAGERRSALRWAPVRGQRHAFHITAEPLDGGAGALAVDVTELEELREGFRRHVEAHDQTLNHLADAVAIFGSAKRLTFHNRAFAELWSLEDAWLAERPSHAEILDRLRQRRRLPETSDYGQWKARELGFYEALQAAPDELWSLPGGRTLRVVRQPHPLGGLLLLFSDITDELKLKAQYNALIGVQKATLDKLGDGVAVFGSNGRLRLHNDAFERFWRIGPGVLSEAAHFDEVVEHCLPYLHDMRFWQELKARVADPGPQARAPISGEIRASDNRQVSFQSRPLPDGATLIAFADVTATRELERALADRSSALSDAERLKRDFVGNVSYELRTPLTTIIGYSELLDRQGDALPERARSHVAAVRQAAGQLAASIDDVLDMAAIDAGELALQLGDTRVDELLQGAAARALRAAEQGRVRLVLEADESSGVIRADEKRLGQVLDHLVANAVRSSPADGVVTLTARRALGEVQIKVADTGRGIPFAVQAHIFDRFVSRDRGGPGLGLALVKAIVELHGGWVALESEPGAGAVFTCHMPERAYLEAAPQKELAFV